MNSKLKFSVGIMAYNEEQNIAHLISAIQNQKFADTEIEEIVVVASGCSDNTEKIVAEMALSDGRIKLLTEKERKGKASAINLWLQSAASEILVMISADTIPAQNALEKIVLPLRKNQIGMTGARPVPTDDPKKLLGYAAHLVWKLHHEIALQNPKMGEMVAFRRCVREISTDSAVDEADIESQIKKQGYQVTYIPEAIVYNKGPGNISDLLCRRRRIHAGHLALKSREKYSVSTMYGPGIFVLLLKNMDWNAKSVFFTPIVILIEQWGRFLGWYDWRIKKKKHHIWKIAKSTKKINLIEK
jgi:poly-beta-1,6-N-acetyl-D-glucosamine synthase